MCFLRLLAKGIVARQRLGSLKENYLVGKYSIDKAHILNVVVQHFSQLHCISQTPAFGILCRILQLLEKMLSGHDETKTAWASVGTLY